MKDAIKQFHKQFAYNAKIENVSLFKRRKKIIVLGMGGSHLAADILLAYDHFLDIKIHSDYGLPSINETQLKKTLVIASSYSGNTEEVIDGLETALAKKMDVVVVATGGRLIAIAKERNLPYIQLPDTGIQPRLALGFSIKALLKIINFKEGLKEVKELKKLLKPQDYEKSGQELAAKLKDCVPVIYASTANRAIAYNWKIKLNETGKIPAFCNVVPELNHNEMTGFDVADASAHLSKNFYFILLKDEGDDKRVQKRMLILEKLYQDRGLKVEVISLEGQSRLHAIFASLILADWTALYTVQHYGLEAEQVPMVEEFKKIMKQ